MHKPISVLLAAAVVSGPLAAAADVTADRAAAILIFPRVVASRFLAADAGADELLLTDTLIQVSNTSNETLRLHCFYVNATSRCSRTDRACDATGIACPDAGDLCLPQSSETDFPIVLTPRQPLAWRASRGLRREHLPLDGKSFVGPTGASNTGSLVPPVRLRDAFAGDASLSIFSGELKCIVVDEAGRAVARNDLKGEATVVGLAEVDDLGVTSLPTASRYNAVGVRAIDGDANGDGILELGGGANEYNGCASVLIAQHFFDDALLDERSEDFYAPLLTELTLVPCTQNLRLQIPGSSTAQFLVFNEFEQRFSTSARVECQFRRYLSSIDTNQRSRSIFSAGIAGTIGGQTRIRGVDTGLIGILTEVPLGQAERPGYAAGETAFHLGLQGDREEADRIVVPR